MQKKQEVNYKMSFNRNLPKWMDEFLTAYKTDSNDGLTKTADLNVEDLPKIVWNEETFYVLFDTNKVNNKPCAHVVNEFGNIVTTLPDANTIELVDEKLNSKNIVPSDKSHEDTDVFEEELKKAAAYINDNTPDVDVFKSPVEEESVEIVDNVSEEPASSGSDSDKRIAELEANLNELKTQVNELIKSQEYARNPIIENLDLNVGAAEQAIFENSSKETEMEIAKEHELDMSTQTGRAALSQELEEIQVALTEEPQEIMQGDEDVSIVDLIELDADESNAFRQKMCPICNESNLVIETQDEKTADIVCQDCESSFKIDKDQDKIYIK